MKAIILAAGYATRLYPLTKDKPKPLLEVAGKPMLEHILEKVNKLKEVDGIYVVTNDKFAENFESWLENYKSKKPVKIIDDGTTSNDDRLGAIGDIDFVVNQENINDDILIVAGDNLFEMSLEEPVRIFEGKKGNAIVLCDVKDKELAKHYGVVTVENNLVVDFEEKPASPKSTLISTGIYLFPRKTIRLMEKYLRQGNNADKTGDFIEWLYKREKVYAYITEKKWYDIGNFEQLEEADKEYQKRKSE